MSFPVILVVDDDDDARALLVKVIEADGLSARAAASGEDALARIAEGLPDLILLDAMMPGMDGFETCRRIKASNRAAHVPVIFMTGLAETEHVVRGLAVGGVDYVTKPLKLAELMARVHVHLGNANKTRSALSALDSLGGKLLACDAEGGVRWTTAEAQRLLDALDGGTLALLRTELWGQVRQGQPTTQPATMHNLAIRYLGAASPDEHLFSISRSFDGGEAQMLQHELSLTPREADVLLWTARGKSNKDMSEILNISARTVNKHLDHVFVKLGVENRAAAAAMATRVLARYE